MTQRAAPLAFPQAFQDDDDDVAWALSTAEVQWKRGAHADALVWLSRAVEAAVSGGRRIRAFQLEQQASALQSALEAGWIPTLSNAEPAQRESYDDGAEPIEIESVSVDFDSIPPRAQNPSAEPMDFTDDTELIEEIEEFDEEDGVVLAGAHDETPQLPLAEISEIDHPTLPPISATPLSEPIAEETTEPDLESEPRIARHPSAHPSETPAEHPSTERSSLRLRSEAASARESGKIKAAYPLIDSTPDDVEGPEQDTARLLELEAHSRESELVSQRAAEREAFETEQNTEPGDVEPEEDTQREQIESELTRELRGSLAPYEPLPSSGPQTAPGGFQAPGGSGPPTKPELTEFPAPSGAMPAGPAQIGGISLADVPGLENLPEETQAELARRASLHDLGPDEEVSGFGLALVLSGHVALMPAIADVAAARAGPGELVFSQGHLREGVPLRVVAGPGGARVASFSPREFEAAIANCPWVGDELRFVGDRFQALAGVCMGPMGESLDDMLRNLVIERCEIVRLLPGEVVAQPGKPVRGLFVLGAGRIELVEGEGENETVKASLSLGDFVFPEAILRGVPAPALARAGKDGALVLFADRMAAHELMVSVPPLLELFAR